MSVLSLSNIEKTFGKRVLFDKLSLTVYPGERIGLIGDNGSGKSSLFKVITGQMVIDQGQVALARGTKIGHLTQDPVFDPVNTVLDEAETAFADLHRIAHKLRELEHDMADAAGEALEKVMRQYQSLQHEFDLAGGYAWRHKLEATLLGMGLDRASWHQNVKTLSGGQRSRLALARLLIGQPDLLLLDEPTNHLDLAAIEWLEKYLLDFGGAVILISHDRFLLDRLATRIVWLNACKLDSFKGNYSSFVQQRELLELTQQRQYEQQQRDIEKQQEFIRRFQAGQRSKEARGRATRLERFLKSDQVVQQLAGQRHIKLSLNTDQRAGDQVLKVRELSKSFPQRTLWRNLSLQVGRGERIGMIGPNGSGKSTLLRVLLGQADADAGEVRWGANLSIGYYDQRLDEFDPNNTVMDEVRQDRDVKEKELRDVLAAMLFRGDDVFKSVGLLSGGERARVRLCQLLLDRPNVLLLDEPTNHLDIASREALESTLQQYSGTIICVSHDRYFLDKLARRLLVIRDDQLVDFEGNYTGWAKRIAAEQAEEEAKRQRTAAAAKPGPVKAPAKNGSRKDNPYLRPFGRLTLEQLEHEIHQTELAILSHQQTFADPGAFRDSARKQQLETEYEQAQEKLRQLEEEYFAREA